ncbi:MAG: serine hydrolase domain-containing protein, partial [Chitinophagales bacterium]
MSCEIDTKTKNKSIEKSKSNRIDSLANRYLELNRFSGTIAVKRSDSVIYHQSFGLADYENKIPFSDKTAFKIGQITELITWSILNKLVKKEKNELSDSVSQYFSELKSDLTVEDLLNQSFYSSNTKDEIDFNTLGRLIEKVSGKSYQENIKEYGDDLELENTYFQKEDSSAAIGYLFHNYRGNGLELQKSPSFNPEIAFSSKGIKSTANDLIKIVSTDVTKELELDGYLETDGFSYSLVKKSNDKIIIIVLSNRRHPVAKEISNSIEAILKNEEYKVPLSRKPFSINSKLLEDYS